MKAGKKTWGSLVLVFTGILVFMIFSGISKSYALKNSQNVQSAFATLQDIIKEEERTGANNLDVQVRVKLENAPFQDAASAALFRQMITDSLGVQQFSGTQEERKQGIAVYRGDAVTGDGIHLTLYQIYGPSYRSDVTVTLQGKKDDLQKIRNIATLLENMTKNDRVYVQIYTCVTGKFNGKLKNDLQSGKIEQVLNAFKGKVVESIVENTVVSVSAFSPQIPIQITSNLNPMNLQVATHVDDFRQETTLTVGTPIITTEY